MMTYQVLITPFDRWEDEFYDEMQDQMAEYLCEKYAVISVDQIQIYFP